MIAWLPRAAAAVVGHLLFFSPLFTPLKNIGITIINTASAKYGLSARIPYKIGRGASSPTVGTSLNAIVYFFYILGMLAIGDEEEAGEEAKDDLSFTFFPMFINILLGLNKQVKKDGISGGIEHIGRFFPGTADPALQTAWKVAKNLLDDKEEKEGN